MGNFFLNLFLPLFLGRSPPGTESTSLSHDEAAGAQQPAVESPESVLLHGADLESGHLEAPSPRNQASEQAAAVEGPDAAPPDHHAVVVAGGLELIPRWQQQLLLTTANHQALGVVTEEQVSVRQRDYRVSVVRAGETGQEPAAKLKEYLKYSFLVISVSSGTLINLFFVRRSEEPLSKNPSLIVASASAFTCLMSAFGLTFGTVRQMMVSSARRNSRPCSGLKLFFCMSTVSLAFTVLSIIVSFLPKAYYDLPLVLVPALLVLLISLYDGPRRDHHVSRGEDDDRDRECSLQLTMNMTAFSFAGALSTVTGYCKNSSNRAMQGYVKVSICFMFSAAITCLLVLLLSRLRGRKDWKKIAVGNAVVLGLLVLAVLIVAATFLGGGGVLAATLFPVAIAVATWYVVRCNVPPGDGDLDAAFSQEEEERKLMYTGAMTAMSLSFGAVMTTFAGFLGGQDKGGRLEVFVFFVVSCFVSSVSLGVITFRAPKKASVAAAAMAMAYLTMVLLVLAALAMVSYVG